MAEDTETRLAVHEAVCAERYGHINDKLDKGTDRMAKLEILMYVVMALVLLGPGVAAEFFKKLIGM